LRYHPDLHSFPTRRSSDLAAVLVATLPMWYVIIDKKQWAACFSNPFIIFGVILGFCGILLMFEEYLQIYRLTDQDKMHLIASVADRKSTRLNSSHVKISYA